MKTPSTDSQLCFKEGIWYGSFFCMASPCELLIETDQQLVAQDCLALVISEARRIEAKFSRYRDDNIIHTINTSKGREIQVDQETTLLLDFAARCYTLSDGLFDITSGVLRRAWRFDCSDNLPSAAQIQSILPLIGWGKITWQPPHLRIPEGMQLDFGGFGKEYAVDKAFDLLQNATQRAFLINFGGDLRVSGTRATGEPWRVGVENPLFSTSETHTAIEISSGALATSGDSKRYLLKAGKQYSHILNPKTGWPVEGAPRSVTVAGPTAIEAGLLATLAALQGKAAESFLQDEDVKYWLIRT